MTDVQQIVSVEPVKIMGADLFSTRDWQREARLARENKALLLVFAEWKRLRLLAMIEAATVEEREKARLEYLAAQSLEAEIELLATQPD